MILAFSILLVTSWQSLFLRISLRYDLTRPFRYLRPLSCGPFGSMWHNVVTSRPPGQEAFLVGTKVCVEVSHDNTPFRRKMSNATRTKIQNQEAFSSFLLIALMRKTDEYHFPAAFSSPSSSINCRFNFR